MSSELGRLTGAIVETSPVSAAPTPKIRADIAELFQTAPQNIILHINAERELLADTTCKEHLQVREVGGGRGEYLEIPWHSSVSASGPCLGAMPPALA